MFTCLSADPRSMGLLSCSMVDETATVGTAATFEAATSDELAALAVAGSAEAASGLPLASLAAMVTAPKVVAVPPMTRDDCTIESAVKSLPALTTKLPAP